MTQTQAPPPSPIGRVSFAINAMSAWLGLAVALVLAVFAVYPNNQTDPTLVGFNEPGLAGLPGRLFDYLGYFTHLSNLLVAVVMTMLWRNAHRVSRAFRVLRLDTLIMISVSGLVFAVVLAPTVELRGWEYLSSSLEHYITPVLTIIVFIVFGPRGLVRPSTILPALILPLAWVAFALVRGAVITSYPYDFIDVAKHGYGTVFVNIAGVVALGVLLGVLFWGVELLAQRASSRR